MLDIVSIILIIICIISIFIIVVIDFNIEEEDDKVINFNEEKYVVEGDLKQVTNDCVLLLSYIYNKKIKMGDSKDEAMGYLMNMILKVKQIEDNKIQEQISIKQKMGYTQ